MAVDIKHFPKNACSEEAKSDNFPQILHNDDSLFGRNDTTS